MKGLTLTRWMIAGLLCLALIGAVSLAQARVLQAPLGTSFTYQGRLTDGGAPANGTYDFTFALYDDPTGGTQVGGTVMKDDVSVNDGLFTVTLDFGNVFNGTALYLEIGVRPGSDTGAYTTLTPRQPLTAAPYAGYALRAPWSGLTGVPAGFADGVDNDTTYTAGDGLTLAGAQFSLSPSYRLPQGCANGQTAQWNGTAWTCVAAGDITAVTAGTGLTGGGQSGDVTLSADTTYLQRRVSVNCLPGSAIRAINADGTVTCENDDNTTYSAGAGLYLNGTQFNISPSYQLPQSCAAGQVAQWNGTAWTCVAAGDITAVTAGTGLTGGGASGDVTLAADTNYLQRRVTGACQPGQYLKSINADGSVVCESPSLDIYGSFCQMGNFDMYGTCSASCPLGQGYIRVGGGCETEYASESSNYMLTRTMHNSDNAGGWSCTYARSVPGNAWWIKAYAICLKMW